MPIAPEAGCPQKRAGSEDRGLRVALAQLPGRLRGAMRLFHDLTGLAAVASIMAPVEDQRGPGAIAPPVHPRCASLLRTTTQEAPCEGEWRKHVRIGVRSRRIQRHVCPLGLRCSCVPIFYGNTLVGIAKFVAGPQATDRRVSLAVRALEMAVSQVCQDFYVSTLSGELNGLRRQVAELQRVHGGGSEARDGSLAGGAQAGGGLAVHAGSRVEGVLEYVHGHYLDPAFSLGAVSRALGLNEKYVAHLFTLVVGRRMHAYVVHLRVQHACLELLASGKPIKQIAYASGFRQPGRFRRAFRRQVGVAPLTYRRVFAKV